MNKVVLKLIPVILFSFLVLLSCNEDCNSQLIDLSEIPDSTLNIIPYKNGDTVKFIHSAGKIINFVTTRKTTVKNLINEKCLCCD